MTYGVNLNTLVKVKLTNAGVEHYRNRYGFHTSPSPEKDDNGYSEFPLWEVMNIWGKYLFNGATEQMFESNNIYIPMGGK